MNYRELDLQVVEKQTFLRGLRDIEPIDDSQRRGSKKVKNRALQQVLFSAASLASLLACSANPVDSQESSGVRSGRGFLISPELAQMVPQDQVLGALNSYKGAYGCLNPEVTVSNASLGKASFGYILEQAGPGFIKIDVAQSKQHGDSDWKGIVRHAASHGCKDPNQYVPRVKLRDGEMGPGFYDGIEEGLADVLAKGLDNSYASFDIQYARSAQLSIALRNTLHLDNRLFAQLLQSGNYAEFVRLLRGIPLNQMSLRDGELVGQWYLRAVSGESVQTIGSEIGRMYKKPLP